MRLEPYENDLNNVEFKTPLNFTDKNTKKCNKGIFSDISEEENKYIKINIILNIKVDIVYLIEATWPMGYEINAVKLYVI